MEGTDLRERRALEESSGLEGPGRGGFRGALRGRAQWQVGAPGTHPAPSGPLQPRFRRCAPESLRHGAFSSASDVWMFGVTLWEMFSGGEEPWAGVPPYLILQRLEKDRARLPRPPLCSRALYALALRCWAPHPADRPSFSNLEGLLQEVGTSASPDALGLSGIRSLSQGSMHKTNTLTPWLGSGTRLALNFRFGTPAGHSEPPRDSWGLVDAGRRAAGCGRDDGAQSAEQ